MPTSPEQEERHKKIRAMQEKTLREGIGNELFEWLEKVTEKDKKEASLAHPPQK